MEEADALARRRLRLQLVALLLVAVIPFLIAGIVLTVRLASMDSDPGLASELDPGLHAEHHWKQWIEEHPEYGPMLDPRYLLLPYDRPRGESEGDGAAGPAITGGERDG